MFSTILRLPLFSYYIKLIEEFLSIYKDKSYLNSLYEFKELSIITLKIAIDINLKIGSLFELVKFSCFGKKVNK